MWDLEWLANVLRWQDKAGNTVQAWLVALAIALVALIVLRLVKAVLVSRLKRFAERTERPSAQSLVALVRGTRLWFLLAVALFCGAQALALPPRIDRIVDSITVVTLLLQAALWGNVLLTYGLERYMKVQLAGDAASITTLSAMAFVGRLVLWTVVVLLALDNVGIDVTAMIAGLGIGGIAVALAAQNILGDLFASLSIVLDKPFVLGDFIVVGDQAGTVEHIGLKTTRVRSLGGEQLVFANNDLLQSRVRNFKRMMERRVLFSVGVTYETPQEKVVQVSQILREAVEAHEKVRFDRAHFKSFGGSSLDFEIVYYVLSPDYNVYMDIQQAINLEIFRRFNDQGIEFAYPTQTLYVRKATDGDGSSPPGLPPESSLPPESTRKTA